jgi:8-oxo-dGTP diphosphatase
MVSDHEFSAGGIVLKKENATILILLAQHAKHEGWGFPKGHIADTIENESQEATAIREVKEETGIEAKILSFASEENYTFTIHSQKRKKTVYYFFMQFTGGDFVNRDHEMMDVSWIDINKVEGKLTYKNAKKMFRKLVPEIKLLAQQL